MLGIPERDNIPLTLLDRIIHTPIGKNFTNPTTKGKRIIHVTELMQKRARLAKTIKTKWKK